MSVVAKAEDLVPRSDHHVLFGNASGVNQEQIVCKQWWRVVPAVQSNTTNSLIYVNLVNE